MHSMNERYTLNKTLAHVKRRMMRMNDSHTAEQSVLAVLIMICIVSVMKISVNQYVSEME